VREPGFYWVRDGGAWAVAEWSGARWWLTGAGCCFIGDDTFTEIGPRITPPGEEPE
jgi:hypothetical protein